MIIKIAEILIVVGLFLFGITAFIKWIDILRDCLTLGDWIKGIFFLGIGLFFLGIVATFIFGNIS